MEKKTIEQQPRRSWWTESVTIKAAIIGFLTLALLIPAAMIQSVIHERAEVSTQATAEVSDKWAGRQLINGPILTIPVVTINEDDDRVTPVIQYWNILPSELNIYGSITPHALKRGIYDVTVYGSDLTFGGGFDLSGEFPGESPDQIQYDKAFLTIGLSDLRGIKENVEVKWGTKSLGVEPGSRIPHVVSSAITVPLPDIQELVGLSQEFEFQLHAQGSQNLSFIPLGKTTTAHLSSKWPSPGFDGSFLPDTREVSKDGFTADWKVLELNRNFPQTWVGKNNSYAFDQAQFGVNLIKTVDDYQKSERSIKYAIMTIALTFLVFFLVEIRNGRRIHPFQYAMVGLALSIFYILLVSISEHSNFNIAYGISFAVIILMVGLYTRRLFSSFKLSALLCVCLAGIYGFIFITLQLEDYALLMGSIGLAAILALTMYTTRNIDWYNLKLNTV